MVAIKDTGEIIGYVPKAELADGKEEAAVLLNSARSLLKQRLSFFVWQGFFEPLVATSLIENQLRLEAPTSFHCNWVKDHYMAELNSAVAEASGQEIKISITNCADTPKRLKPRAEEERSPAELKALKKKAQVQPSQGSAAILPILSDRASAEPSATQRMANSNFNPLYSFESFVQGPSNQMAFAAAQSASDHPGSQFSPLFLFGGVGLGKTHLLNATGIRAKDRDPTLRVIYLSAEQWVNSYIQSIRERQFDSFRNRYRQACDMLLIDDIQFLAGKDASQDEFFHTFNCLHEAKKQIVVTSDKYPHEIDGLEERLQTRLSWGLIADIRPPEIETRIAILHKKAERLSIKLSDEILHYLGTNVISSVRELEGALMRLAACASLSKAPLDLSQAKEILTPMLKKKTVAISWQKVNEIVAAYYDLRSSDLIGKSRERRIALARQIAMTMCRTMLSMSLPEIGRVFGGRDHSTVLSSIRKINEIKNTDVSMQSLFSKLENKLASLAS